MLSSILNHSDSKVITDDLYNNMLTICGVPRLQDSPSGGDTGQARLIGEGWTMADERAKQDELAFKKSERQTLKLILDICKQSGTEDIKDLEAKDIEVKFTRNKNDNLLVKTQGLLNMKDAQVDPNVAFATCGLFSDANEVYNKSKKFYGENFWNKATERDLRANPTNPTDGTNIAKNKRQEVIDNNNKEDIITEAPKKAKE